MLHIQQLKNNRLSPYYYRNITVDREPKIIEIQAIKKRDEQTYH